VPVREEAVNFILPAARAVVQPEQLFNPMGGAPAAIPAASMIPSFVVPASRIPETPTALPVDFPVTLNNPAEVAHPVAVIPPVEFTRAMDAPGVLDAADLAAAATPENPAVLMQPAEEIVPPAVEPSDDDMDRRLYRPITQVTVNAALPEGLSPGQPGSEIEEPPSPPTPVFGDARLIGGWPMTDFQWSATAMRHKPLYFEEVNLERYGYTVSPVLQPLISGAHFFATIPVLPYKMTTHPPYECYYTLGHYRPGSCAPRRWHHEPWDPLAAAVEAGTVVGLIYIIP